jgi:hypothetical protein
MVMKRIRVLGGGRRRRRWGGRKTKIIPNKMMLT